MIKLPLFSGVRRAVAVITLATFALPAGAAPQIEHGTWIDSLSKLCGGTFTCTGIFTAVPAGKTLIARNISCRITIPTQYSALAIGLTGNNKVVNLVFGPSIVQGSSEYYVVNTEIFDPFKAGAIPTVNYTSNATAPSTRLNCTLSGELRP